MSRVAGTVAKVVFFLIVVAGATFLFRKDSLRGISDHWTLMKCPDKVTADVLMVEPWSDPKVDHCEGTPVRATCFIETTEKSGRKKGPIKNWDCTQRHIRPGAFLELGKLGYQAAPVSGEKFDAVKAQAYVDKAVKVKEDFVASIKYVTSRLDERRELLGEPRENELDRFRRVGGLGALGRRD